MKKNIKQILRNIFTVKNMLIGFTIWLVGSTLKDFIQRLFKVNVFVDFYSIESILFYLFMPYFGLKLKGTYSNEKHAIIFVISLSIRLIIVGYFGDSIPENIIELFSIAWVEIICSIFSSIGMPTGVGGSAPHPNISNAHLMESSNTGGDGGNKRGRGLEVPDKELPKKRSKSNLGKSVSQAPIPPSSELSEDELSIQDEIAATIARAKVNEAARATVLAAKNTAKKAIKAVAEAADAPGDKAAQAAANEAQEAANEAQEAANEAQEAAANAAQAGQVEKDIKEPKRGLKKTKDLETSLDGPASKLESESDSDNEANKIINKNQNPEESD